MSFTATVQNGFIKLPENNHLPNGSQVFVELIPPRDVTPPLEDWIDQSVGVANSGLTTDEILKLTRSEG